MYLDGMFVKPSTLPNIPEIIDAKTLNKMLASQIQQYTKIVNFILNGVDPTNARLV